MNSETTDTNSRSGDDGWSIVEHHRSCTTSGNNSTNTNTSTWSIILPPPSDNLNEKGDGGDGVADRTINVFVKEDTPDDDLQQPEDSLSYDDASSLATESYGDLGTDEGVASTTAAANRRHSTGGLVRIDEDQQAQAAAGVYGGSGIGSVDDDQQLYWIDDYSSRKAMGERHGKRGLKHSLVKKNPCHNYNWIPYGKPSPDKVVVERPRKWENGQLQPQPKTEADDLFPEFLDHDNNGTIGLGIVTTLGRGKQWENIPAMFEQLEEMGKAHRVDRKGLASYQQSDLRFESYGPLMDSITYSVPANGYMTDKQQQVASNYNNQAKLYSTSAVYGWRKGKWRALYELKAPEPLTFDDSDEKNNNNKVTINKPLKGKLKSSPGTQPLDGPSRRAFAPGVAATCGAGCWAVSEVEKAVVETGCVDLVFGGAPVTVKYASVAGRIHDTKLHHVPLSKKEDYQPSTYNDDKPLEVNNNFKKKNRRKMVPIHVAIDGTEAYCDRVEISARMANNNREWISLGLFNTGCEDGHTEKAIPVGGKEGIRCVALRFRAVSWRGSKPYLRVGAYGVAEEGTATNKSNKKSTSTGTGATTEADNDDGDKEEEERVLYTLHFPQQRDDGTDDVRRRYTTKKKHHNNDKNWWRPTNKTVRRENKALANTD